MDNQQQETPVFDVVIYDGTIPQSAQRLVMVGRIEGGYGTYTETTLNHARELAGALFLMDKWDGDSAITLFNIEERWIMWDDQKHAPRNGVDWVYGAPTMLYRHEHNGLTWERDFPNEAACRDYAVKRAKHHAGNHLIVDARSGRVIDNYAKIAATFPDGMTPEQARAEIERLKADVERLEALRNNPDAEPPGGYVQTYRELAELVRDQDTTLAVFHNRVAALYTAIKRQAEDYAFSVNHNPNQWLAFVNDSIKPPLQLVEKSLEYIRDTALLAPIEALKRAAEDAALATSRAAESDGIEAALKAFNDVYLTRLSAANDKRAFIPSIVFPYDPEQPPRAFVYDPETGRVFPAPDAPKVDDAEPPFAPASREDVLDAAARLILDDAAVFGLLSASALFLERLFAHLKTVLRNNPPY